MKKWLVLFPKNKTRKRNEEKQTRYPISVNKSNNQ